jgi:hypothetical protein
VADGRLDRGELLNREGVHGLIGPAKYVAGRAALVSACSSPLRLNDDNVSIFVGDRPLVDSADL